MEKSRLAVDEIRAKLVAKGESVNFPKAGKVIELSDDDLEMVAGGVGSWSFDYEGSVWSALCNKSETNNAMFEYRLATETACQYASAGASSCYNCQHMYLGNTGVPVV